MRLSFTASESQLDAQCPEEMQCTLHQFSKGNNQLYLYMLYKYKQLLIAHSIGLQRVRNRVCCWKWSSSPSASVQNRVQISVHSPVHESSPESRVQVLHQPRNFSIIGGVARSQTKCCISTTKRAIGLKLERGLALW